MADTKKPLKKCPGCGKKLTPNLLDDFGAMVFIECASCQVVWDWIPKGEIHDEAIRHASVR